MWRRGAMKRMRADHEDTKRAKTLSGSFFVFLVSSWLIFEEN